MYKYSQSHLVHNNLLIENWQVKLTDTKQEKKKHNNLFTAVHIHAQYLSCVMMSQLAAGFINTLCIVKYFSLSRCQTIF